MPCISIGKLLPPSSQTVFYVMYAEKQAAPIRLEQIKNHAVSDLESPPKMPCHRVHVFLIFALSVLP